MTDASPATPSPAPAPPDAATPTSRPPAEGSFTPSPESLEPVAQAIAEATPGDVDPDEVVRTLTGLPDQLHRDYELALTRLAERTDLPTLTSRLAEVMAGDDPASAYAAFYTLNIVHRRNRDYTLLERLINTAGTRFRGEPSFQHLQVLFTIDRGVGRRKEELIRQAYEDSEAAQDNAGFVHLFADVVASMAEESDADSEQDIVKRWLPQALEAADRAIALDRSYAKYYATKARLMALGGQFDEALDLIRTAIDLENSARPDYAIRIGEYQSRRLWIQARRNDLIMVGQSREAERALEVRYAELRAELDRATQRIEESTVKNLEFLGFFAGLISFTIASVQIAAAQSFHDASRLVLMLMGAMLVAFAGFGAILDASHDTGNHRAATRRLAVVAALGVAVVVLGRFL